MISAIHRSAIWVKKYSIRWQKNMVSQIDGAPRRAAHHARELAGLGADGVFTFEGPHDVFLPLVAAAGAAELDLMTNVAIAGPRSPLHLAHAAYDLQVYSGGRFRLGLGSQIKVHI